MVQIATGMTGGEAKDIAADKKVILLARAIPSPKVLMLTRLPCVPPISGDP